MTRLQIIAIGDSAGVVIPKEVLAILGVEIGDTLYVVGSASGIELTRRASTFAAQMDLAEDIMRANSQVLGKLAR